MSQRPTDAELAILKVLWDLGPATVRDVHAKLCEVKQVAYTTILRFMQIMLEKGLVHRDDSSRAHVFSAALTEESVQRNMLRHLVKTAFRDSPGQLVMRALADKDTSREELDAIRNMLDDLEEPK